MFKVTDPKSHRHSLLLDSHARETKTETSISRQPQLSLTHQANVPKDQASPSQQSAPSKKIKKQNIHCAFPLPNLTRHLRADKQPEEYIRLHSYTSISLERPTITVTPPTSDMPTEHQAREHNPPPTHYRTHVQIIPLPSKPKLTLTYQADFSNAPTIPSKLAFTLKKSQQILLTIPLPKPSITRHLHRHPIEEVGIKPSAYTPIISIINASTRTMDLLSVHPTSEQQALAEHEQLYRTLSTSDSYRSASISTPDGKLLPHKKLSIAEYEKTLAWFWGWARENCRNEKIDEVALLKVRQHIQEIHDNKGYRLLGKKREIWDIRTSYQYQQAALDFYAAAGISKQEQRVAALHWAKSGEFYALTQLFLFPIRAMRPLFDIPGFDTIFAKASINFARGIFHAHAGGFLSPAFDVLAAFTKKGKPFPSSVYWQIPSHYGAVQQLDHCIRQVSNLLADCRKQQIPVPDELINYLEHARHLYKMANAKTYCYSAASAVSGVTEIIKGIIDATLALISGGFLYSVSNIITSSASSLIYCLSGPCEELSAMNQIRLQNAKYADIFNSKGEIDKDKVMGLWHDPHQVDQSYIEQIFCQQTAEYLYKLNRSKRRGQFFEAILANPDKHAQQIYTQKTAYEEEISFLRKQITVLKPEIHKQQRSDIDFLLFLKENTQNQQLLKLSAAPYASVIEAEYNKYLPEKGKTPSIDKRLDDLLALKQLINDTTASPPTSTQNVEANTSSDELLSTWLASLKTLCNGKRLLEDLEHKLQRKEKKLTALNKLDAPTVGAAYSEEKVASIRNMVTTQHKKYKQYEDQLEKLMNDYYIFNVALNDCRRFTLKDIELGTSDFFPESEKKEKLKDTLAMMSSQSFLAQLLSSRATLMRKSIQVTYQKPGILLTRALERLQLDVLIVSAYELAAFHKNLQPQAASLGLSSWAAVTVQEVARTQVNREPYITRYVHNLHRPDIILEQGNAKRSIDSLMGKRYPTEYRRYPYIPNEDDMREFLQNYTNVRSHPESKHLIKERIRNNMISSVRLSTDYIKRTLMRYPLMLDLIKGPRANTNAKKLINQISAHNLSLRDTTAPTPPISIRASQGMVIKPATEESPIETTQEITNSIRQMGSWNNQAGDLVAQPGIISNVIGRSIKIIHCDTNGAVARVDQTEYNPVQQLPPITLIYNGFDHYDVLLQHEQSQPLQKTLVLADNDCFYRALLSALHNDPHYAQDTSSETTSQIQALRDQFADYLDLHQDELEENILYVDSAPPFRNKLTTVLKRPAIESSETVVRL